jgi:hypothetical protein
MVRGIVKAFRMFSSSHLIKMPLLFMQRARSASPPSVKASKAS